MIQRFILRLPAVVLLALLLFGTVAEAVDAAKTIVYITKTGEKYHKGSCQYLRKSKIKTTLKQAKEDGYDPCSVCEPPE